MPFQLGIFKIGPPESDRPRTWQDAFPTIRPRRIKSLALNAQGSAICDLQEGPFVREVTLRPKDLLDQFVSEGFLIPDNSCDFASPLERRWDPYGSGLSRSQLAARCHCEPTSVPANAISETRRSKIFRQG